MPRGTMNKPLCDMVAEEMVKNLSFETKLGLYKDLKKEYPDRARDIMEAASIEEAIDEFAFHIFWSTQHRLLAAMKMSDEEIERSVY